jgi:hypothetical protein
LESRRSYRRHDRRVRRGRLCGRCVVTGEPPGETLAGCWCVWGFFAEM